MRLFPHRKIAGGRPISAPNEPAAFTAADLPTLRRIRDMHWRWYDEGAPADFTPDQAKLYRIKVCYTAEWCARVIALMESR